jgi:hypothetical protein
MSICTRYDFVGVILFFCSTQIASAQDIILTGNQALTVNTSNFYNSIISLDNSQLTVLGGTVNQIYPRNTSNVSIQGGSINLMVSDNTSNVTISGGFINGFIGDSRGNVAMTGGTVNTFADELSLTAQISGGTIVGNLYTSSIGETQITGGNLNQILHLFNGTTTIHGDNLMLSAGAVGTWNTATYRYDGQYYTLTGRLQNNTAIGTYSLFDADSRTLLSTGVTTSNTGKFIISSPAPEPRSIYLFTLGIFSILIMLKKR